MNRLRKLLNPLDEGWQKWFGGQSLSFLQPSSLIVSRERYPETDLPVIDQCIGLKI